MNPGRRRRLQRTRRHRKALARAFDRPKRFVEISPAARKAMVLAGLGVATLFGVPGAQILLAREMHGMIRDRLRFEQVDGQTVVKIDGEEGR